MDVNHLKDSRGTNVVVCTDISSEEPHKHVVVSRVIAPGSLASVMVSMLALKWQ